MTKEEAIKYIQNLLKSREDKRGKTEIDIALEMSISALKQQHILGKIRAEIMDTGAYEQEVNGKTEFLQGIDYCLGVIDKCYSAKSEDKTNETT